MSQSTIAPRAQVLLDRVDAWSQRDAARALLVKVAVTVVGPLVILAGVAMLVLPGPGLVVIAAGLGVLALEYHWARRAVASIGHQLARAKEATLPREGSRARRALGAAMIAGVLVAGFLATTAITAALGALAIL